MPADTSQAPGLSFLDLFRRTKERALRELIGTAIIHTLEELDPELVKGENLITLAKQYIDPAAALRDQAQRDQIIRLMPLPKARELAERLDVGNDKDLYPNLQKAAADKSAIATLYSFFGVVEEERAPRDIASSLTAVDPNYGLFDHQRVAAEKVTALLSNRPNKVILHMPTGSGKTRTAMHIIATHLRNRRKTVVCWLAQNAELLDQAAEEFEKAWASLGDRSVDLIRFWGNRNPKLDEIKDGVIVAGLAKMFAFDNRDPATMLALADRVSLTVIDEAHQAIAPSYASIQTALYKKRPESQLLGLTATPGRTWSDIEEDEKLSEFFDRQKVMLEVEGYDDPVSFLIEEGYLARPVFSTLNADAEIEVTDKEANKLGDAADVPDDLLDRLGGDTKRNLKVTHCIEDLATRHRRIIVFAPSVTSARLLSAILLMRGHDADVVTGETPSAERSRIVRKFRGESERPMIICNYGVLTTGFDAPSVSAAVIARPTKSLVLYSQMVGRATRGPKAGGNPEAEIVTVVDPGLPGFGSIAEAFANWEDVWNEPSGDRAEA